MELVVNHSESDTEVKPVHKRKRRKLTACLTNVGKNFTELALSVLKVLR